MASRKRKKKNKLQPPKKRYGAVNFIFLTYGICWLAALTFYLAKGDLHSVVGFVLTVAYLLIPAGIVLLIYNNRLLNIIELEIRPNRWFLLAILIPVALGVASTALSTLLPQISFSPSMQGYFDHLAQTLPPEQMPKVVEGQLHPFWMMTIQTMLMALTVSTFMALGEELGFRGLLLEEWRKFGFWKSSVMSGITWGIWYVPLVLMGYNYPENPNIGAVMMVLWCIGVSPLVSWVRIKGHSVAVAALFHGAINGVAGLTTLLLIGSEELTGGLLGFAGLLTLALANLMLWFFSRKNGLETVSRPLIAS